MEKGKFDGIHLKDLGEPYELKSDNGRGGHYVRRKDGSYVYVRDNSGYCSPLLVTTNNQTERN
jgi:hypothetical protein